MQAIPGHSEVSGMPGQKDNFRDNPGKPGTVGNYAIVQLCLYLSKNVKIPRQWSEDNFPIVEVLKYGAWRSR